MKNSQKKALRTLKIFVSIEYNMPLIFCIHYKMCDFLSFFIKNELLLGLKIWDFWW
jgi:hypothetical protein